MIARSSGVTHDFVNALRELQIRFSISFDLTEPVRDAILAMPESAWVPAITQTGEEREGAAVCELTNLDLATWPEGTRAICRRERPHPGAQLTFTDHLGFRFQVFITDQDDGDLAQLEARHRAHAHVEDRIRCGKDTGLRKFPFRQFAANQVWLELVLAAQDLLTFLQRLCLDGEARRWEPKRLRHRLLHVAGAGLRCWSPLSAASLPTCHLSSGSTATYPRAFRPARARDSTGIRPIAGDDACAATGHSMSVSTSPIFRQRRRVTTTSAPTRLAY